MFIRIASATLASTLAMASVAAAQDLRAEVIDLDSWSYDVLYAEGISADDLIEDAEVRGADNEEIGDVEDLLISADGRVVALIAEVGGFWDIGDTHVSVPWDEVTFPHTNTVVIPVTEESIDDYPVFDRELLLAGAVSKVMAADVDGAAAGPRLWRVTELIGDYVRVNSEDAELAEYGYVTDVILRENGVAAVVVQANRGMGADGTRAYPFYGYGNGWTPGAATYDMPYARDDAAAVEIFDRNRLRPEAEGSDGG